MNDEQKSRLLDTLASAFDRAALNCGHKAQAARFILADLEAAGFKVEMRKSRTAKTRRDVARFLGA